ncbi:MAG: hypothetical protein KIS92_20345, partial [Planctomycetota bacterium]|nr:hypothetical protein [Planctomycetota bacterium]
MAPDPARRTFQFHLSTCVMLMFLAGGLIALNVIPEVNDRIYNYGRTHDDFRYLGYGWPDSRMYKVPLPNPEKDWDEPNTRYTFSEPGLGRAVLFNLICWLVILALAAALWEGWIRWRRR